MLLAQVKEREHRFKLALRIGLPIFALVIILISNTLISSYDSLELLFYIESLLLIVFSIYFILFIIYNGYEENITDIVTKTFSREYLFKMLKNELQRDKPYTILLFSIDNLNDINSEYGLKNGDKILFKTVQYFQEYLEENEIKHFPMGHLKGGDFLVGLEGEKSKYENIIDLFCIKTQDFNIDNIEVHISSAILDTNFSRDLNYLIEGLFELQDKKKHKKQETYSDLKPNELESLVLRSVKEKSLSIFTQDVYDEYGAVLKECFVRLKVDEKRWLYPKDYLKVLNRSGLTLAFDMMILEKYFQYLSKRDDQITAISITPSSLRTKEFTQRLEELMIKNPHARHKLMIVLFEKEYFYNIERYNSLLQTLRKLGIYIAIDRVGESHTSFLYLRDLSVDAIRFDTNYVKDEFSREAILEGFIFMAKKKGIKSWMKLLQDEQKYNFAKSVGVDYFQGKHLSELVLVYES